MHKLLVNLLYKPAQEKVWLGELLAMTIAVDLGHKALKQTNKTKMIAMPILGKTLLNIFSGTTNVLGTWYLALGFGLYQVCTNDESGLTLTYLTARPNLIPNAFKLENS